MDSMMQSTTSSLEPQPLSTLVDTFAIKGFLHNVPDRAQFADDLQDTNVSGILLELWHKNVNGKQVPYPVMILQLEDVEELFRHNLKVKEGYEKLMAEKKRATDANHNRPPTPQDTLSPEESSGPTINVPSSSMELSHPSATTQLTSPADFALLYEAQHGHKPKNSQMRAMRYFEEKKGGKAQAAMEEVTDDRLVELKNRVETFEKEQQQKLDELIAECTQNVETVIGGSQPTQLRMTEAAAVKLYGESNAVSDRFLKSAKDTLAHHKAALKVQCQKQIDQIERECREVLNTYGFRSKTKSVDQALSKVISEGMQQELGVLPTENELHDQVRMPNGVLQNEWSSFTASATGLMQSNKDGAAKLIDELHDPMRGVVGENGPRRSLRQQRLSNSASQEMDVDLERSPPTSRPPKANTKKAKAVRFSIPNSQKSKISSRKSTPAREQPASGANQEPLQQRSLPTRQLVSSQYWYSTEPSALLTNIDPEDSFMSVDPADKEPWDESMDVDMAPSDVEDADEEEVREELSTIPGVTTSAEQDVVPVSHTAASLQSEVADVEPTMASRNMIFNWKHVEKVNPKNTDEISPLQPMVPDITTINNQSTVLQITTYLYILRRSMEYYDDTDDESAVPYKQYKSSPWLLFPIPIAWGTGKEEKIWAKLLDYDRFVGFSHFFFGEPLTRKIAANTSKERSSRLQNTARIAFFCTKPVTWTGRGDSWRAEPWHTWIAIVSKIATKHSSVWIYDCNAYLDHPGAEEIDIRDLKVDMQLDFISYIERERNSTVTAWISGSPVGSAGMNDMQRTLLWLQGILAPQNWTTWPWKPANSRFLGFVPLRLNKDEPTPIHETPNANKHPRRGRRESSKVDPQLLNGLLSEVPQHTSSKFKENRMNLMNNAVGSQSRYHWTTPREQQNSRFASQKDVSNIGNWVSTRTRTQRSISWQPASADKFTHDAKRIKLDKLKHGVADLGTIQEADKQFQERNPKRGERSELIEERRPYAYGEEISKEEQDQIDEAIAMSLLPQRVLRPTKEERVEIANEIANEQSWDMDIITEPLVSEAQSSALQSGTNAQASQALDDAFMNDYEGDHEIDLGSEDDDENDGDVELGSEDDDADYSPPAKYKRPLDKLLRLKAGSESESESSGGDNDNVEVEEADSAEGAHAAEPTGTLENPNVLIARPNPDKKPPGKKFVAKRPKTVPATSTTPSEPKLYKWDKKDKVLIHQQQVPSPEPNTDPPIPWSEVPENRKLFLRRLAEEDDRFQDDVESARDEVAPVPEELLVGRSVTDLLRGGLKRKWIEDEKVEGAEKDSEGKGDDEKAEGAEKEDEAEGENVVGKGMEVDELDEVVEKGVKRREYRLSKGKK